MEKKLIFVFELFFILLFLVFLGPGLSGGLSGDLNLIDEGQFASWAHHMLYGKQMYKDLYITYGPFHVYPVYVLFKIFGPSAAIVRLYILLFLSFLGFVSLLIFMRVVRFPLLIEALIIVILLFFPSVSFRQWIGILALTLLFVGVNKDKKFFRVFSGIFLGVCLLVSIEIGMLTFCLSIALFLYFAFSKSDGRKIFICFTDWILGMLAIIISFALWSLREGWFFDYLYVTKDVLHAFSGIELPNGQGLLQPFVVFSYQPNLISGIKFLFSQKMLFYWTLAGYIILLFIFSARVILRVAKTNEMLIGMLVIFGLDQYVTLIGRSGHYAIVLPPFLVASIYYLYQLQPFSGSRKSADKFICLFLVVAFAGYLLRHMMIYRQQYIRFFHRQEISNVRELPRVGFMHISKDQERKIQTMQRFISQNTTERDYVFFLSDMPMMYMLVARKNPSRFDLPFIAHTKEKRLEILNSFIMHPPKYIIEDVQAWKVDGVGNRQRLPEIDSFIKNTYKPCNYSGTVIFFCLKKQTRL